MGDSKEDEAAGGSESITLNLDGELDGMNEISQLLNDYTSLQAAHRSLIQRCDTQAAEIYAEVQEEMEILRSKVTNLEEELAKASSEKEELNATVRDLRVRVEESRRAIMRLQGGSKEGSSSSSGTQNGSTNALISGSNNNRRSIGPGALASWNPKEINTANIATDSTDDSADLKKSKRASLAFGPNAQASMVWRSHGRTTSGGNAGQVEDGSPLPSVNTNINPQGLRELTLGGPSVQAPSIQSSKRTSFIGSFLSPSASSDTGDAYHDTGSSPSSLLMPARPIRRTSNGSNFSNSARDDNDGNLYVSSSSRSNASPGSSNKQLPISEVDEDGMIDLGPIPQTARPGDAQSSSLDSTFSTMQQPSEVVHLRRMLVEQKIQVQSRDHQVINLQRELQTLKMELEEAKEARLASEACLKALRDFVKEEGGSSGDTDGAAKLLKGVKLPPLPTDKDTDDYSTDVPFTPPLPPKAKFGDLTTPTLSSSAWRSIGTTFAGLSRTKTGGEEESARNISTSSAYSDKESSNGAPAVAPMSPAASLGNSIGNFWARSTAPKNRDSMSTTISTAPSEASKETTVTNTTSESAPSTTINTPVSATAFKGFGWFNKRSISEEVGNDEKAPPTISTRVSSPPFANLDHNVITLDTSAPPLPDRKASRSSSFAAAPESPTKIEPNGRTKKAKEKSDVVDEDSGFVPPAFQQ